MAEADQDKTEMPTPKRLEDARQEGQLLFSQDVVAAVLLAAGLIITLMSWQALCRAFVSTSGLIGRIDCRQLWTPAQITDGLLAGLGLLAQVLAWPLLVLFALAVAATWGQTGFYLSFGPFKRGLEELDLSRGLQRLMPSVGTLTPLVLTTVKVLALGVLCAVVVCRELKSLCLLPAWSLADGVEHVGNCLLSLSIRVLGVLAVIAAADYLLKRRQYLRGLMMTREEIREEMRSMEGDPLIKGRLRQRMRQLLQGRLAKVVPQAHVVVTNPTHVAVALRYQPGDWAPRVVAKGLRKRALRIRTLAAAAGVPIVENPPLARALYKEVPSGGCIGSEFFAAVAVVLAGLRQAGVPVSGSAVPPSG